MDWSIIYAAAGTMLVLGLIFGLGLAAASKKFAVRTDPRIEHILDALPGVNCGACGYGGCADYAETVVMGGAPINLCIPGGAKAIKDVAEIMGVQAMDVVPTKAIVECQRDDARPVRFEYAGLRDCRSANLIAGGFTPCKYACLGLGTCVEKCPFDAIHIGPKGIPVVDEEKCTSCGNCVRACPRNIITIRPDDKTVHILCKSHDKGALARKACNNACIACRRCVKECPFDAIEIVDNLAKIDYDKCKACGKCVAVCPNNCIVNYKLIRGNKREGMEESIQSSTA